MVEPATRALQSGKRKARRVFNAFTSVGPPLGGCRASASVESRLSGGADGHELGSRGHDYGRVGAGNTGWRGTGEPQAARRVRDRRGRKQVGANPAAHRGGAGGAGGRAGDGGARVSVPKGVGV